MRIDVINLSPEVIEPALLKRYVRAVNRQVADHFAPEWELAAKLEILDIDVKRRNTRRIDVLPGDAVIYVGSTARRTDYAGFHDTSPRGTPYGVVYQDIADKLAEPLSVTLSHEVLELIADPQANLFAAGPHPDPKTRRTVLFWYEACDAVQDESYEIDGVAVSNFVTPLYFTLGEQRSRKNDYLGKRRGYNLRSFGVNRGGYVGYTNPGNFHAEVYEPDDRAKQRRTIKGKLKLSRRSVQYGTVRKRVLDLT
jgi:hypothetical protein